MINKKRFGQHFLHDLNIVKKIVRKAEIEKDDVVWEIGPGKCILTKEIISTGCSIYCFEIDYDLFDEIEYVLNKNPGDKTKLLIRGDVLEKNWDHLISDLKKDNLLPKEKKIKLVANIPYNISTPLLFKISDYSEYFSTIVIMVQKELAQRLKALPGSKDYGVLSLKIQYYFELEYLFTVKPHLFIPPPSVDSSVIKLKPRSKKPFLKNKNSYFELITKSFAYRRKTLRNNLKNYLGKEVIEKIDFEYYQLKMEFLNLSRRGESLDEREFVSLSNYISDNFC